MPYTIGQENSLQNAAALADLLMHPREKSHGSDEDARNVTTFLSCISGLMPGMEQDFHLIAATENTESLDSAILSRFSTVAFLPVPSDLTIEYILKKKLGKIFNRESDKTKLHALSVISEGLSLKTIDSLCDTILQLREANKTISTSDIDNLYRKFTRSKLI